MSDIKKVRSVLENNRDKNFVQRILEPERFPVMNLPDGRIATHMMAYSETHDENGKKRYRVYPTILFEDGQLTDYGDDAFERATDSGEYIDFDEAKDADWFSKNYKKVWK
jgi:hypothetical protein